MSSVPSVLIVLALAAACARAGQAQRPAPAPGPAGPGSLPRVRVESAFPALVFTRPVQLVHAGDRLFVVEQAGRIRSFENRGDVADAPDFLDVRPRVYMGHNEEGLLSLAFDPAYAANGVFYAYYSALEPRRTVLSRFRRNPGDPVRADPDSEEVILEQEQPYGNHKGGTILFGPDGFLYLSLGDGGSANDPMNNGQDLSTLLGKIIRIDVARGEGGRRYAIPPDNPFVGQAGARGEIWAWGLRNVWRMSFDRKTGELWAGDVGQNAWEEVDLIVRGGNFGWRIREGAHPFRDQVPQGPLIDPVAEYPQRIGREVVGLSITGGFVYRGSRIPALAGAYVYGDYVTGRIWALRHAEGRVLEQREIFAPPPLIRIASFGEDAAGELYVCSFDTLDGRGGGVGRVYRLTGEGASGAGSTPPR
jgi:glucose/arabinose dehydrogenase